MEHPLQRKNKNPLISVVVPVYRAVDSLEILVEGIQKLEGIDISEIILVYDCGPKVSWGKIKDLVIQYDKVIGIRLNRNYGQHNATICGFEYAKGEYIITLDEDLQHEPSYIPIILSKLIETGDDVVYAISRSNKHSIFRNLTSYCLRKILKYAIPDLHKDFSSFRVLRKSVAVEATKMRNPSTFLDGYLTWITQDISSVEIDHFHSYSKKSSYSIGKLIEHSINIFSTFSNLPLRWLCYFSFLFFIFSFGYSVFIIINTLLFDKYQSGFPTIVALLGFGFGFILLGIGILGEYIQKINLKTTERPNYLVKEVKK